MIDVRMPALSMKNTVGIPDPPRPPSLMVSGFEVHQLECVFIMGHVCVCMCALLFSLIMFIALLSLLLSPRMQ